MIFLDSICRLFDHTDKKVENIYRKPKKKLDDVENSLQEVNEILYHKDTAYYIAKAIGKIK